MKLSPKVKQIIQAEADFVALVDRPANRIPFRIMKSEDGETELTLNKEDKSMSIDLGKIGQFLTKKAPAVPQVTTMVVAKSIPEAEADQMVKDAGLSVASKTVTEDAYVYKQADATKGDAVVQLTDDVAITVGNLSKAFYDYDYKSSSFEIVNATNGFYPSLYRAQEALGLVVSNIMEKSDNAGSAKAMVKSALSDFTNYASMLVDALPETAFKAELVAIAKNEATRSYRAPSGIAASPMSSEADKPNEVRTESPEVQRVAQDLGHRAQTNTDSRETGPAETQNPEANHAAAEEVTGAAVADGTAHTAAAARNIDAERQPGAPRDVDVAEMNDQNAATNRGDTGDRAAFIDRGDGVANPAEGQATGLQNSEPSKVEQMLAQFMDQFTKSQEASAARFDKMEQRLEKSEQVLRGTVAAPAPTETTPMSKSASAGAPPLLDTAFYRD